MLTYTTSRTQYGIMTNNQETTNLDYGTYEMNAAQRYYASLGGGSWWFLEKKKELLTVASQQGYVIPATVRKIVEVYITVGNEIYTPFPVENATIWTRLLQQRLGTSDRVEYYYREGNQILFYPTPSSADNTITIRYRRNISDLRNADYTTGTVSTTFDDETVTGSGTTFTADMVGRSIVLDDGDGIWYEIDEFTSTTSLELVSPYQGVDVTGSTFTIGETFVFPEAYQELPLLRAVGKYWRNNGDLNRAQGYFNDADAMFQAMQDEAGETVEGAYLAPINDLIFRDPNIPEPDVSGSAFI